MTPSRTRPIRTALCVSLALLAACASSSQRAESEEPSEPPTFTTTRETNRVFAPRAALVAPGSQGIESHIWLADDSRRIVPELLAEFLDAPVPIEPEFRDEWNAAGLRLTRIPLDRVTQIERDSNPISDFSRTWHQAAGVWVEFFRSQFVESGSFAFKRRIYRGEPGFLRLVGRVSVVPADDRTPTIRLELAAQVHQPRTSDAANIFLLPRAVRPLEQGEVFHTITLRANLDPGFAYAITCETPALSWRDAPPKHTQQDPRDLNPDPPAPNPAATFGPSAAPIPSLGQKMLATPRAGGNPPGRTVILLIPRAKPVFSLLR